MVCSSVQSRDSFLYQRELTSQGRLQVCLVFTGVPSDTIRVTLKTHRNRAIRRLPFTFIEEVMVARQEHLHSCYCMPVVAYFAAQPPTHKACPLKFAGHIHEKSVYFPYNGSLWSRLVVAWSRCAVSSPWDKTVTSRLCGLGSEISGTRCVVYVLGCSSTALSSFLGSTCPRKWVSLMFVSITNGTVVLQ